MASTESLRAQQTAHVALMVLGAEAYAEVLILWGDVALGSGRASAASIRRFLAAARKVIALRRRQAAQVTVAHQRLQRTLRVGRPLDLPDVIESGRKHDSLEDMRRDFEQTVKDYAPGALKPEAQLRKFNVGDMGGGVDSGGGGADALPRVKFEPYRKPRATRSDRVDVEAETLERLAREADALDAKWEKAAADELEALAREADRLDRLEQKRRAKQEAKAAAEARKEAQDRAARRIAASAAANVRGMSHELDLTVARRDEKVIGYVRVHYSFGSGKPCAFCAMLLSRGVAYKSAKTAGGSFGSPYQYHPNCKCKGEPVYQGEDYESDPRFKVNRFYRDRWKSVVSNGGHRGDKALRVWRRNIDAFNRHGG